MMSLTAHNMRINKKHPGVTLLIALLILSTILAVSFSLATILLAEARNSGDLLRTEPALYADNAISEEAIFNVSRNTGVTSYSSSVGPISVTSSSTPLNDPVQEVKIISSNTAFGCTSNCYVLYNPGNPYGSGGYSRIQVTFLNTNTSGAQLHIYLCQWDPANPPRDLTTRAYANVCSQQNPTNLTYNYMTYQDSQPLSPGQTWDTSGAPPGTYTCGGCIDTSGHDQEELILYQTNGTPVSNIYAQISTWDIHGNPLGIPYFGETAVTISAANSGVSRDLKVVVPNQNANASSGGGPGFISSAAVSVSNITGSPAPTLAVSNSASGNLVYVSIAAEANGAANCNNYNYKPVDSESNTYTQIGSAVYQAFNCSSQWYAKNITSTSTLFVTANVNGGTNSAVSMVAYEFSGLDTSSPLDSPATKTGTNATAGSTSSSFSTAQSSEVVFMSLSNYYHTTAWTAGNIGGNGSTIDTNGKVVANDAGMSQAVEYYITSSAISSGTAAITQTSASHYNDWQVAAFKAAP